MVEVTEVPGFRWQCPGCLSKETPARDPQLPSLMDDIAALKQQNAEVMKSIQHFSDVVDDFSSQFKQFTEALKDIGKLKNEVSDLKKENAQLREQLNEVQQFSRRDNLEIHNIP